MESTTPMTTRSNTETTKNEKREKVINRIKEIAQKPESCQKTFKTSELALFFNFENDNDLECFRRWLRSYFPEERRTLGRNGTDLNLQDFANFACYPKKRNIIERIAPNEYRNTLKDILKEEFVKAGIEFIVAGESSDDIPSDRLGNANDELKEKYENHKEKWIFVDEKYLPPIEDLKKSTDNASVKSSEASSINIENVDIKMLLKQRCLSMKDKREELLEKIKSTQEELNKIETEIKQIEVALKAFELDVE